MIEFTERARAMVQQFLADSDESDLALRIGMSGSPVAPQFDLTLVGMTESAVSHQLRLLRAARLVRVRRSGRLAYYSLDDHHVVGLLHDTRKHVEEAPGEPGDGGEVR